MHEVTICTKKFILCILYADFIEVLLMLVIEPQRYHSVCSFSPITAGMASASLDGYFCGMSTGRKDVCVVDTRKHIMTAKHSII